MEKSKVLETYIDSGYIPRPRRNMRPSQKGVAPELTPEQRNKQYQKLKDHHAKAIHLIAPLLNSIEEKPPVGSFVWAVQDLTSTGRGIFLHKYLFNAVGFVHPEDDDAPHGFITHWVLEETVNKSTLNIEKLLD